MRARVIKSRERKWYRIGEIYLVRNTEKYEGIGVQVWNTDENIPHPVLICLVLQAVLYGWGLSINYIESTGISKCVL